MIVAIISIPAIQSHAAGKAKLELEFTDGSRSIWKTEDEKLELGKKKLAYVYFGNYPQTEINCYYFSGVSYDGVARIIFDQYDFLNNDIALCPVLKLNMSSIIG
ncbi:MAG: hypothetical protein MJ131_01575 [Lachnospiraceae bacterium]|nr:hypothetical protein [Lachnospiraceae bacterium]